MSKVPTTSTAPYVASQPQAIYRLWVDGVGAFLVCLASQVTIGGPSELPEKRADISLLSNLSRHHVRLIRSGEVWLLEPLGPVQIDGRHIVKHTLLSDRNSLHLGSSVVLKFHLPCSLSGTARLDFESSHQTQPAVDGVILLADTCVIGGGADAHVRVQKSTDRVLLIRRPNGLWCKSPEQIEIDGIAAGTEVPCEPNRVYAGQSWQFRLEAV